MAMSVSDAATAQLNQEAEPDVARMLPLALRSTALADSIAWGIEVADEITGPESFDRLPVTSEVFPTPCGEDPRNKVSLAKEKKINSNFRYEKFRGE